MNAAKELFLATRTLYTVGLAMMVSQASGFGLSFALTVGLLIFVNSFVFQYFVLHWALKQEARKKVKLQVMFIWLMVTLVVTIATVFFIASIDWAGEAEQVKLMFYSGVLTYVTAAAAFVGGAMTRRSFEKHGTLG